MKVPEKENVLTIKMCPFVPPHCHSSSLVPSELLVNRKNELDGSGAMTP